jgi:hypothetical protein
MSILSSGKIFKSPKKDPGLEVVKGFLINFVPLLPKSMSRLPS